MPGKAPRERHLALGSESTHGYVFQNTECTFKMYAFHSMPVLHPKNMKLEANIKFFEMHAELSWGDPGVDKEAKADQERLVTETG